MTDGLGRRAVVLGAGPAGLMATWALEAAGVRVALLPGGDGRRQVPARHHVHVLPMSARRAIQAVLGDGARDLAAITEQEHPDGEVLDKMLETACLPQASEVRRGAITRIAWDGGGVRVLTPGGEIQGDVLIDATGTARASFRWAAACANRNVPVDFAPGRSRYTSVIVANATKPQFERLVATRDRETGWGVLLLGLGGDRVRLTVQSPASTPPVELATMLGAVRRMIPHDVADAISSGTPEGSLQRWGPHPVTRTALEDCEGMPEGWFPVGDALLVTPPHLAGGVRHAAEHAADVARGIADGQSFISTRMALAARSQASWLEATVVDALSAA